MTNDFFWVKNHHYLIDWWVLFPHRWMLKNQFDVYPADCISALKIIGFGEGTKAKAFSPTTQKFRDVAHISNKYNTFIKKYNLKKYISKQHLNITIIFNKPFVFQALHDHHDVTLIHNPKKCLSQFKA